MVSGLLAIFIASNIVLAQTTATTTSSSSNPSRKTVDLVCMQTVVDTRENALLAARITQGNAISTAYQIRKPALHEAWNIANKTARRSAVKAAWKTWNDSMKKANKDWRTAKHAAWVKFEKDRKTCRGISISEEVGNETSDQ